MIDEDDGFELILQPESDILLFRALRPGTGCRGAGADAAVTDVTDVTAVTADTADTDEGREAELDLFNVQLQNAQKLLGRTFVSRTAVSGE